MTGESFAGDRGFVELAFRLEDDAYPAVRLSEALDGRAELLETVHPPATETVIAFFHVDADPFIDHDAATAAAVQVGTGDNGERLARLETEESVARTLAAEGVPLQTLVAADGTASFVATVPPGTDTRSVVERVQAEHPTSTLVRKRRRKIVAPFTTQSGLQAIVDDLLTERQAKALRLAFERGRFERPHQCTQADLANAMGVAPSTYSQHHHAALRKVLAALFDDDGTDDHADDD